LSLCRVLLVCWNQLITHQTTPNAAAFFIFFTFCVSPSLRSYTKLFLLFFLLLQQWSEVLSLSLFSPYVFFMQFSFSFWIFFIGNCLTVVVFIRVSFFELVKLEKCFLYANQPRLKKIEIFRKMGFVLVRKSSGLF
jgi:hypothetical protein